MKTCLILVMIAAFCNTLHAQQSNTPLAITHLTGDFYVYTTYKPVGGKPYPSNSMYVVTKKGIVLIDTPWDTTQFQPLLDSIEARHHQKAVLCIATHYHDDRTGGLDHFSKKGIATWSSQYTKQLCITNNEKQAAHTFTNDTTFTIGGHTFQTFYPGEGHTKDNIVIWFKKEKVLYGGCFVKSTQSKGLGNIADANVTAWPQSVQKLMSFCKNPLYVIPGHMSWEDHSSLSHTLQLLQPKEAQGN